MTFDQFTTEETAAILGIPVNSLLTYIKRGYLKPHAKGVGRRSHKFRVKNLLTIIFFIDLIKNGIKREEAAKIADKTDLGVGFFQNQMPKGVKPPEPFVIIKKVGGEYKKSKIQFTPFDLKVLPGVAEIRIISLKAIAERVQAGIVKLGRQQS